MNTFIIWSLYGQRVKGFDATLVFLPNISTSRYLRKTTPPQTRAFGHFSSNNLYRIHLVYWTISPIHFICLAITSWRRNIASSWSNSLRMKTEGFYAWPMRQIANANSSSRCFRMYALGKFPRMTRSKSTARRNLSNVRSIRSGSTRFWSTKRTRFQRL